jgi:Mg2+ and Co2+ transporter CorA
MTETDTRAGAIGGQLGTRAARDTTFPGRDPDTVAGDSICHDSPTRCQARTHEDLMPYYQDVYDHVLRAAEWTESLRDLVATILETNLTIQGNRMNVITKKVTSWAAIIAVPTFITGFYGMNVPYPGFGNHVGLIVAALIMIGTGVLLYWVFRRNDWL